MTDPQHNWQQVKAEALRTAASIILPIEIAVDVGNERIVTKLDSSLRFKPLGIEGFSAVNIHAPDSHSIMLVRGQEGAHSERVSLHHYVSVNVLEGSMLYFKANQEPILVEAWQPGLPEDCATITFEPDEPHGFVVIKPCLNYTIFTPHAH